MTEKKLRNPYAGNPFNALRAQTPQDVEAHLNSRWEHSRVDFTMLKVGLARNRRALIQANEEFTGVAALTFAWLRAMQS